MNSKNTSQTPMPRPLSETADSGKLNAQRVEMKIRQLGPCPSFKNGKRLFVRPDGKTPGQSTRPEVKQWMQRAARAIAFQLLSACQIAAGATTRACSKQSAMLSLPPDDCWEDLEIGSVRTILVEPGEEGADIVIERL